MSNLAHFNPVVIQLAQAYKQRLTNRLLDRLLVFRDERFTAQEIECMVEGEVDEVIVTDEAATHLYLRLQPREYQGSFHDFEQLVHEEFYNLARGIATSIHERGWHVVIRVKPQTLTLRPHHEKSL
jgi:hypothetical protein